MKTELAATTVHHFRYLKHNRITYRVKDSESSPIVQQWIEGGWGGSHWADAGASARQAVLALIGR